MSRTDAASAALPLAALQLVGDQDAPTCADGTCQLPDRGAEADPTSD